MNQLKDIEKYILYGLVFLIPVLFTTFFQNNFLTPKLIMLVAGCAVVLVSKSIRAIDKNEIGYKTSKIDLSILLLVAAFIASAVLITPNKMEAFFLPGNASVLAASAVLYFLINQLDDHNKDKIKGVALLSGTFVAVFSLLAASQVFDAVPQLPEFIKSSTFSTTGGNLPTLILLVSLLPIGFKLISREHDMSTKALWGISTTLITFGVLISIINILPGKPSSPQLAPFTTAWSIAIDALKANPILGIGPGNYLTAFNVFRPISYNSTEIWQLRFTTPRSILLEVVTETGLIGIAGLLLLIWQIAKRIPSDLKEDKSIFALIIMFIGITFFPPSITLIAYLFIYLSIFSKTKSVTNKFNQSSSDGNTSGRMPTIIVTAPVIISVAFLTYYSYGIVKGEYTYYKALAAANRNEGQATYNLLRSAINTNPYVDRYHASYSQVNLALANSIAASEEITDQQRNTIAQLIQQAIREGKSTVSLNPQRAGNWELLGNIYRSIIPLAEGADSFALQSYNQAVTLDPANPNLRILLGGILYGAGNYESAIDVFKLAVRVKPDHPNAHYNLAIAYREAGQVQKAKEEFATVLSLVDSGSNDYNLVIQALEDLDSDAGQPTQNQQGTDLTPPQESNVPALEPPLELPKDAEPPETEANNATKSGSTSTPTPLP